MNGSMQNGQRDNRPTSSHQTSQSLGQEGLNNEEQGQASPQHALLTPTQMAAFKAQIYALRFLQKGLPIPAPVASVIFSNGQHQPQSATAPSPASALDAASPGTLMSAKQLRASPDKMESPAPYQQQIAPLIPTPDVPREQPQMPQQQPMQPPQQQVQEPEAEPELEIEEVPDTIIAPYNAYKNPRTVLAALRSAAQQHQQDSLRTAPALPSLLPHGLDAYTLQQERNKFIEARIGQRRKELESLPSLLGDGVEPVDIDALEKLSDAGKKELLASQKLKAVIELKSLNLLQRQRQLREDVVRGLNQAVSLNLVADRTSYRAQRKITLKDARIVDQLERQQKIDRENRAKQKHLDQLLAIAKHGRALEEAHQAHRQRQIKLGRNIMRWHIEAEKEEQKRIERISKERLKALRNNDEEAYLKLIDTAKDTRITHLLRQTDSFLDSLAQAVVAQQADASDKDPMAVDNQREGEDDGEEGEAQFGAAPVFQDEVNESNKVDYYGVAHRIKETVSKQPTILTGGTLKEYQIKGLQWMISLYNNRLNGILADEMVSKQSSCSNETSMLTQLLPKYVGSRKDYPDDLPYHIPNRVQETARAIPMYCTAVDSSQLGARIREVGTFSECCRVQGISRRPKECPSSNEAARLPSVSYDVRVHHQRSTLPLPVQVDPYDYRRRSPNEEHKLQAVANLDTILQQSVSSHSYRYTSPEQSTRTLGFAQFRFTEGIQFAEIVR